MIWRRTLTEGVMDLVALEDKEEAEMTDCAWRKPNEEDKDLQIARWGWNMGFQYAIYTIAKFIEEDGKVDKEVALRIKEFAEEV